MTYEYSPVGTDDKAIKEIVDLLRLVFPKADKYSEAFIKWQYKNNPDGSVVGFNAYKNSVLVAHYALIPFTALLFGEEEKGLLSLNTATHPDHQGNKLFTTLAALSYTAAAEKGYGFVIGVANENSTHGFVNKLGFQWVGKLDAKIGLGKIVHSDIHSDACFLRIWSNQSVVWRLSNPANNYKIVKNSIYSATDKPGIEAILLDISIVSPLPDNKVSIGFRPIKLFIGIDHSIQWSRSLYFSVPKSLRPSPLNFIFKDLSNKNRRLDIKNVSFNAFDFDAY